MSPGPYVVTTKRRWVPQEPMRDPGDEFVLSRVAVAMVEEAQRLVRKSIDAALNRDPNVGALIEEWTVVVARFRVLSESGGTITLPDGTVIEVEPTTWLALVPDSADHAQRVLADHAAHGRLGAQRAILHAFNVQEAKR